MIDLAALVVGDRIEAINGDAPAIVMGVGYAAAVGATWVLAVRQGYMPFRIDDANYNPDDRTHEQQASRPAYWRHT